MSSELLASGVDNLKGNLAGAFNMLTGSSGDYTDLGIGRKFGGAAAAYSLRDVGAMNGPVVRVRRDSDNSEQDFSALAISFIADFVNESYVKYTSDFSSGDDSWAAFDDVTETGNIDGIGGLDNNLRLAIGSATSQHRGYKNGILPVNQKINFSARVFIPSTNSVVDSIRIKDASGTDIITSTTPAQDQWVTVTASNITTVNSSGQLRINLQDGGVDNFAGNGSDVVYIREVVVTQITADGFVETWYDQSGNNRPLIQTTATNQPLIVENGVFLNGVKANEATSSTDMMHLRVSTDGTTANFGTDDWASGASSKLGLIYVGTVLEGPNPSNDAVVWGGGRGVSGFQAGGVSLQVVKSGTDSWKIMNERQGLTPDRMSNATSSNTDADVVWYGITDNRDFTVNVNGSGDTETQSADLDVREDQALSLFGAFGGSGTAQNGRSSKGVCKECFLYAGDNITEIPTVATKINQHYSIY
jgi:hypothetical protein